MPLWGFWLERYARFANVKFKSYVFVKALAAMKIDYCFEPKTIDEALNGVDANHWKGSISETISGYIKNKTWEIVNEPKNKNINCKWHV